MLEPSAFFPRKVKPPEVPLVRFSEEFGRRRSECQSFAGVNKKKHGDSDVFWRANRHFSRARAGNKRAEVEVLPSTQSRVHRFCRGFLRHNSESFVKTDVQRAVTLCFELFLAVLRATKAAGLGQKWPAVCVATTGEY
jgi:hypothetical protein